MVFIWFLTENTWNKLIKNWIKFFKQKNKRRLSESLDENRCSGSSETGIGPNFAVKTGEEYEEEVKNKKHDIKTNWFVNNITIGCFSEYLNNYSQFLRD